VTASPPYPKTFDRVPSKIRIRRQRYPERRLMEEMVVAYLESGAQHGEAVSAAQECFKALNLRVHETEDLGQPVPLSDLKLVRRFAVAACRSGAAPFTAATRAVGAWKDLGEGREALHGTIDKEEAREARRKKGTARRARKVAT
jgi:hypothetical protein